jgi:hypothetical protein
MVSQSYQASVFYMDIYSNLMLKFLLYKIKMDCIQNVVERPYGRDHLEELGRDRRKILK